MCGLAGLIHLDDSGAPFRACIALLETLPQTLADARLGAAVNAELLNAGCEAGSALDYHAALLTRRGFGFAPGILRAIAAALREESKP